jgi:hypothetical protein
VVDEIVVGVRVHPQRWSFRRRLDLRSRLNATSPTGAGRAVRRNAVSATAKAAEGEQAAHRR